MPSNVRKVFLSLFVPAILLAITACPGFVVQNIGIILGPDGAVVGAVVTVEASVPFSAENIDQFLWNFGDGGSSAGMLTNHIYTAPGTYLIELRVVLQGGSVVTYFREIQVTSNMVLDLVVMGLSDEVQACEGDALGGFSCSGTGTTFSDDSSAAAGDFNEDGNLDYVVVLDNVPTELCLGDGSGGFTCSSIGETFDPSTGGSATTSGDYNNDDHIDFYAVIDFNTNSQFCAGDGAGGFTCSNSGIFNFNVEGASAVSGDFNEDDDLDVVVMMTSQEAQFCAGDGTGTFACGNVGAATNVLPSDRGYGGVVGDFNEDDDLDFIILPFGVEAIRCLGDGTGSFTCSGLGITFTPSTAGLDGAEGDFDEDGHLDFVVVGGNSTYQFCMGDGTGSFSCSDTTGTPVNPAGGRLDVLSGDFITQ